MDLDLGAIAPPLTRQEAIRESLVTDCTATAAFMGFTKPCGVTREAWEEVVGNIDAVPTRAEVAAAVDRLQALWKLAADAVTTLSRATGLPVRVVYFHVTGVKGQPVPVRLTCTQDRVEGPVITIDLHTGE